MKLPPRNTTIYGGTFVLALAVFAFLLLTYTRRVDGVSMRPTFEEGDLVVIQPVQMSSVSLGDVIVYSSPCSRSGFSVIHRVVGLKDGGFLTRGDNALTNLENDQDSLIAKTPIYQDCLTGKVIFVVPYLELVATLPYELNYVIAGLIFVVVIFVEFRNRSRSRRDAESQAPAGV